MLKKAKAAMTEDAPAEAKDLAQSVLDSSHQIWLAGVGAFMRAQKEGKKVFESLVQQGEKLERRTKQAAADTAGAASAKAKEMQQMAGGTWDKLEQVFEDRVARALGKLGVYTQNDVQKLAARVDALSSAVNKLLKTSAAKPAARKASARARSRGAKKSATGTASARGRKVSPKSRSAP